jgi:hypothetical protein
LFACGGRPLHGHEFRCRHPKENFQLRTVRVVTLYFAAAPGSSERFASSPVHANRERAPLTIYAAFGALNDHDALGKARILMALRRRAMFCSGWLMNRHGRHLLAQPRGNSCRVKVHRCPDLERRNTTGAGELIESPPAYPLKSGRFRDTESLRFFL